MGLRRKDCRQRKALRHYQRPSSLHFVSLVSSFFMAGTSYNHCKQNSKAPELPHDLSIIQTLKLQTRLPRPGEKLFLAFLGFHFSSMCLNQQLIKPFVKTTEQKRHLQYRAAFLTTLEYQTVSNRMWIMLEPEWSVPFPQWDTTGINNHPPKLLSKPHFRQLLVFPPHFRVSNEA